MPRSGSRVQVPSRALLNEAEMLIFTAFPLFLCVCNSVDSCRHCLQLTWAVTVIKNIYACILFCIGIVYNFFKVKKKENDYVYVFYVYVLQV